MITDNETIIKVENLYKSFGDIKVLKGIDNEIKKGEVVVVIGASGSGKSTFLRTLNLLEQPTSGHIYFEGIDIADSKVDIDKHRRYLGMTLCKLFNERGLLPEKPGACYDDHHNFAGLFRDSYKDAS